MATLHLLRSPGMSTAGQVQASDPETPVARKLFEQPRRPALHGGLRAQNRSLHFSDRNEEEEGDLCTDQFWQYVANNQQKYIFLSVV